ncbi:hypothetical protein CO669_22975 [Bradyrhizobium sp. Y36]|uniref:hypothetical protein n=1 Tax=Bradyrhizobium sp. Y36 TaxID=2035447 RepID=UPI000BEB787C|nr:hypothetical protein [Bradyrhizobium sp. Y36]PDT87745.1 hypothetical protein CO669_22975 [Bradyrhizobium sp. Y36]
MRVGRDETIRGVRLIKVRDLLRFVESGAVRPSIVMERLGCDEAEAVSMIEALLREGYIEKDVTAKQEPARLVVSDLGIQLCNAKFVRRISRAEAERLVAELLERVKQVNERDELTHRITSVRVFGSYLGDNSDLGDVDLAIQYTPRRSTHVEEAQQRAEQSGKSMSNFLQVITYGTSEIRQILKNKSPYLSLHEHSEPDRLGVGSRVLFAAP